ncbi:MAG TPA: hypothetical protein VEI52_03720 [Terriglobales bacterium]|nr:hypothetical protein [Terriglobales bacterium]
MTVFAYTHSKTDSTLDLRKLEPLKDGRQQHLLEKQAVHTFAPVFLRDAFARFLTLGWEGYGDPQYFLVPGFMLGADSGSGQPILFIKQENNGQEFFAARYPIPGLNLEEGGVTPPEDCCVRATSRLALLIDRKIEKRNVFDSLLKSRKRQP